MKLQRLIPLVLITLLIAMPASQVVAQGSQQGQCQRFVRQAYSDLSRNCLQLGSNVVCYGHEDVTGMMINGMSEPADFFADPGFQSELTYIARVTGSAFNLNDEIWGLSKLNIQTYSDDVENDDPETADDNLRDVLMLLMGDMEIENAVDPTFDDEDELVIDENTPGPFNELYVRGSSDVPECEEAVPPILLLQGADDADTSLVLNDTEVQLNAGDTNRPLPTTAIIEILDYDDPFADEDTATMRVITLSGMVTLNPDGNELTIPPGYYTDICLFDPGDRGLDEQSNDLTVGCGGPTDPALVTEDMLTPLEGLQGLPGNVLRKPVIVPSIIVASGTGGVIPQIIFGDPEALELAREMCEAEPPQLPPGICRRLFG